MKFPLDQLTFDETMFNLMSHVNMQTVLIEKLSQLLTHAMDASEHDDDDWFKDSTALFSDLRRIKVENETARWNKSNYEAQNPLSNLPTVRSNVGKVEVIQRDDGHIVGLPGLQFDEALNMKANKVEEGFGPEMSEEEMERMFSQKRSKVKKVEEKKLAEMTMTEIEDWEAKQNNATDIYKVAARVKNLARGGNASLTAQGEILCNTYVHVMMAFYAFSDKIEDKNTKIQLISLIRSQEGMPGTVIAAAGAGVKLKK